MLTISENIKLNDSSTLNIHGLNIPSLPTDLCGQTLAVNSSGDDLEWIKSDSVGGTSDSGSGSSSGFYENACTDITTSSDNGGSGTSGFYTSLLSTLGITTS